MRRIILREGPLVFIRNVLVMEGVAALFLYAISFLQHYENLYRSFGWDAYLRYNTFVDMAFSFFQVGYILILFLDWYFSLYEINDREIVKRSGLLFKHRKSVVLSDVVSVELYQSPISRVIKHATIILEHSSGRVTKFKNIGNYEEYLHSINQAVRNASAGHSRTQDVASLLKQDENIFLEFKETLRYDVRKGEVSKEIERMVLKTIVGFLNAEGGTLLIGVSDEGEIVGLANDFKTLPKKNRDGFENHLSMLVKTCIGLPFAKYISVNFETVESKDVCRVSVKEGHKPAYLRNGDRTEEFFVRVGNSTQPFSMSEAEEYIKTNWK